jgi:mannosyltransferase
VASSTLLAGSEAPARDSGAASGRSPARHIPTFAFAVVVLVGFALRIWNLGGHTLNFDETFTAMAARRSPGDLFQFLRTHDSHPPLDYLIRVPFSATGNDVWMRVPSVLFSTAALAVFAWWMRNWGRAGLLAAALFAISGFELYYGREARMYALMQLVGVVVAFGCHRWLLRRTTASAVLVGVALLVGVFAHVSGLLLAAGVFLLAGRARDRAAWRWRMAVAAPVLVWAALWGAAMNQQRKAGTALWIPHTTPTTFVRALSQPLSYTNGFAWLIVAAIVGGAVLIARTDRPLAVVGLTAYVVPVLLGAAVGVGYHFFIPRTLAFGAWAPLLAVAFLLDAALRRWRLVGAAAVALVAVVVLASAAQALRDTPLSRIDQMDAHLRAVVRPGDVVTTADWERSLVEWPLLVQGEVPAKPVRSPLHKGRAFRLDGRPTGRVWLVQSADESATIRGYVPCARPWRNAAVQVHCLRAPS